MSEEDKVYIGAAGRERNKEIVFRRRENERLSKWANLRLGLLLGLSNFLIFYYGHVFISELISAVAMLLRKL